MSPYETIVKVQVDKKYNNKKSGYQIYVYQSQDDLDLRSPLVFCEFEEDNTQKVLMRGNLSSDNVVYYVTNRRKGFEKDYIDLYNKAIQLLGDKTEWIKKN